MSPHVLLLAALCAACAAFCPDARAQDAGREFKIGFTLPLSGTFAEFGGAVQNSLKLAREEHPSLFDGVRIIQEDDQYSAKNTISAFHKLKDVDGAHIVIVWGNEPALAAAPLAESSGFPMIAFGQTPAIAVNKKHVLRVLGPANEFGAPIAKYLTAHNVTSMQILLVENTFYRLISESVKAGLPSSSSFNILASVPSSEMDFRSYLLKAKKNPGEYLGVFLAPGQLIPFFKQANDLRVTNPMFGSTSFESKAVVSEARQLMNGAIYSHVTVEPAWHAKYLERFGDDIQVSYAAVAYDTFLSILKIVKAQGTAVTGGSVLESLAALPEQHGASGKYFATSSTEDGRYIQFGVALKKISNGKVELVP